MKNQAEDWTQVLARKEPEVMANLRKRKWSREQSRQRSLRADHAITT